MCGIRLRRRAAPAAALWLASVLAASLGAGPAQAAAGSCNSVGAHSTCIDYTGSYWSRTPGATRGHCKGPGVSLDREACDLGEPFGAARFGSCIYNQFAATEFITHFYTIGGGGFDTPGYDFNLSRVLCQRTGGVWVWGPRSGR